ncbi:MAG: thymidine kinase [Gammaproteobacteria bacterium]|nr:thymidine kinase [Gammaproteobacteria bacterium]
MAKLYFYYSAMNAGKSTTLLQSAWNYRERGLHPVILSPVADRDSGQARVSSRIGISSPALLFGVDDDLFGLIDAMLEQHNIHCVLVDEAQFLSQAQVRQLSDVVDDLNIPVLTYGLRTDFRGQLFPGSSELLAWADELVELKTICHTGRKATMVVRVDEHGYAITDGAQVEIGGNERYVSVSRREFKAIVHGGKQVKVIDRNRLEQYAGDQGEEVDQTIATQQSLLG